MNAHNLLWKPGSRGVMLSFVCVFCILMTDPLDLIAQQPAPGIVDQTGQQPSQATPSAGGDLASQQTVTAQVPPSAGGDQTGTPPPPLQEPAPGVIEQAIQQPPTSPLLPPGPDVRGKADISAGQTLNVNQCIEIALRQNTAIMAASGNVQVSRSRVGEARSDYYPQLSASAGYAVAAAPSSVFNTNKNRFEPSMNRYDSYTGSVDLTQNILNPRTWSSVKAAKQTLEASQDDQVATENNVVLNVKTAYYQVLQAKRDRDVAADVIKGFQLHLDQAQGFYDVGTKAKVDVIKAQVDLSNAKLALIKAQNSYQVAWLNLNTAMGVPDAPQYTIEDDLSYSPYPLTLEEATARAFENRPDLKSAAAKREAAATEIGVAQAGYYPVLSGNASYLKGGANLPPSDLNEGWFAGVNLSIPIFSGFLTRHQVAEAKGNFYVQKANEENQRQQILLQVRQAYLGLRAAESSISTAELAASQAKENLDLQNGRYAAGVGSPVEVSDAFAIYVQNQSQYTFALAIYKIAQATIEQAMGMR